MVKYQHLPRLIMRKISLLGRLFKSWWMVWGAVSLAVAVHLLQRSSVTYSLNGIPKCERDAKVKFQRNIEMNRSY